MSRSQVCICIPAYNAGDTLADTLDSILRQTYRDLKIVVVDNASTDSTAEIASSFAANDARVSVSRNPRNVGGEGNFSRCIELASGDYTAIFHSDDIYSPEMVARQVEFLDANPEAGAVFTMAVNIDASGRRGKVHHLPGELKASGRNVYGFAPVFRAMLRHGNFLFCPSAMVRTPVYKDHIKVWDRGLYATSSDADVWLRILGKYKIGVIDEPLLQYRVAQASYSYAAARLRTTEHDMLRVFRDYISSSGGEVVGPAQVRDFELLTLKDHVNRAFNFFVGGRNAEARKLLRGLFGGRAAAGLAGRPDFIPLYLFGCLVFILAMFPFPRALRGMLCGFRYHG